MPYGANGTWTPEDDSVAKKVTGLLSKNSPLVQTARTQASQTLNRRGLLNSTMAGQAGEQAAIGAVLPIASQEAQQTHQKNMQQEGLGSQERIASLNVGAHDRQYVAAAGVEAQKTYAAQLNEIIKNNDLSSENREKYTVDARARLDNQIKLLQGIYGPNVVIDWTPLQPA